MVDGRFGQGRPAPTVTGTSIAGADYVDYQGAIIPMADITAFLNTPEGRMWASSGYMGTQRATGFLATGEKTIQYVGGDWTPFAEFQRSTLGKPLTGGGVGGVAGAVPATRVGATPTPADWYPPARWGTPIEQVTEFARPEYDPAWYAALEAAKPQVSTARYEWMAGLRPEVLRRFQAQAPISETEFARQPYRVEYEVPPISSEELAARVKELSKTVDVGVAEEQTGAWAKKELQRRAITAEETARASAASLAKVAAEQRQAKWGTFAGAYPFTELWGGMAPRARGEFAGRFAPQARWYV